MLDSTSAGHESSLALPTASEGFISHKSSSHKSGGLSMVDDKVLEDKIMAVLSRCMDRFAQPQLNRQTGYGPDLLNTPTEHA